MPLPVPNLDSFQKQLDDLKRSYPGIGFQSAPAAPAPASTIKYVDGIAKAREYQNNMPPGSSEIIMDKNDDIFYVVSKDTNGSCPTLMTMGRFQLEQEQPPEAKYATKEDFAAFEARITQLLNNLNKEDKHE